MILIDTCNLYSITQKKFGRVIDYQRYLHHLPQEHKAIAFVMKNNADGFVGYLQHLGIQVFSKKPFRTVFDGVEHRKINWNVELTIQAFKYATESLIIGSNDLHLLPLIRELSIKTPITICATNIPTVFQDYATLIEINEEYLRNANDSSTQRMDMSTDSICDGVQDST